MPATLNNRKLLVSVYTAQEAREAVLGGGRIIDSEDPKSALGNISPRKIMAISNAVLDYRRDLDIQLSTNIGEDQLIFRRTGSGEAIEKSPQEMAGKAAQAALGVAVSMGTEVHPCSFIKVGLDGMDRKKLTEVLREVVETLRHTREFKQCPVMSVLFAQNLTLWNERKRSRFVRSQLVAVREFSSTFGKEDLAGDDVFSLSTFWGDLRDGRGNPLPPLSEQAPGNLKTLQKAKILPEEAKDDTVVLNELQGHHKFFGGDPQEKTTIDVIRKMVDVTVEAGADAMMLDTSILTKVCNVCLVDTSKGGMVNLAPFIQKGGVEQRGILSLEELKFFVEYCHFRGIVPNVAGSVDSIQAQQLWAILPGLDQISTRSAASAALVAPSSNASAASVDTRQLRTIVRQLVSGLAPPEHGGVLNVPIDLKGKAEREIAELRAELEAARQSRGLPPLRAFFASPDGSVEPMG